MKIGWKKKNDENTEEKLVVPREMSKKKKWIIIGGVCVLAAAVLFGRTMLFPQKASAQINTGLVTRGNIEVSISGSGTVQPLEQYDVVPLVKGDILADYFDEGDYIEKGAPLYKIDSSDIQNSIEKAQLNLTKAKLSYNQVVNSYDNLQIKAPFSGTLESMELKEGNKINNGTTVGQLIDHSYATVTVPFLPNLAENFYVGQSATVTLTDSFATLNATVSRIATSTRVVDGYTALTDVELRVENPGNIMEGQTCQVKVGEDASYWEGSFAYGQQKTVTAETSGTVNKIYYYAGDYVEKGDVIAELVSDDAATNLQNSKMSVTDAELSLQNLQDQLKNYNLTSPISGTVMKKSVKAGDTMDNSNSTTVMAVIADLSKLTFEISVDELDIANVKVGQKVTVTADSTPDVIYEGTVTNVGLIGTAQNGVTSYPVEITIDEPGDLLPGMNVSANIIVNAVNDVLMVPVSAVQRGNWVAVKDGGNTMGTALQTDQQKPENAQKQEQQEQQGQQDQQGQPEGRPGAAGEGSIVTTPNGKSQKQAPTDAPEGFTYVQVEIGLNNADYIEIKSGLKEGDTVYLPRSSNNNTGGGMNMVDYAGGGTVTVTPMPESGAGAPPGGGPGGR